MPKFTYYELRLDGDNEINAMIQKHLPEKFDTIAEANAKRRAIMELFGLESKVVSVRRSRIRRRVLRI